MPTPPPSVVTDGTTIEQTVAFKIRGVILLKPSAGDGMRSISTANAPAPAPSDRLEASRSGKPGHSLDILCHGPFCARACVPCVVHLSAKSLSGQSGVNPEKGSIDTLSRSVIHSIFVYPSNNRTVSAGRKLVPAFLH